MIYKVEMITTLLVEAVSESEANVIAFQNLENEVKNGTSHWHSCELIKEKNQLNIDELRSLPWRSHKKQSEPESTVLDILSTHSGGE